MTLLKTEDEDAPAADAAVLCLCVQGKQEHDNDTVPGTVS